ncbi:MAG: hypothetical protein V3U75_10450 [Methylococcaceae bacterium]
MKCIICEKNSKKRDRDLNGNKCRFCGHPFVTEPSIDRLTDMAIRRTEDIVSSNGTFFFLEEHLKYHLMRRAKNSFVAKAFGWTGCLIGAMNNCLFNTVSIAITAVLLNHLKIIDVTIFLFIIFVFLLLRKIMPLRKIISRVKSKKTIRNVDKIVQKWIEINPNPKLLTKDWGLRRLGDKNANREDLEEVSFDRVLICDCNEYVDFFLANLFHFHYSCPVLGGNNYPEAVCADMLCRLKKNPNLDIFLLHDFTPAGYAFVDQIRTDPNWFGDRNSASIIDLGLIEDQKYLFESLSFEQTNRTTRTKTGKKIAELTIFKPDVLISMCGMAINERVPLHETSKKTDYFVGYG